MNVLRINNNAHTYAVVKTAEIMMIMIVNHIIMRNKIKVFAIPLKSQIRLIIKIILIRQKIKILNR